MVKTDSVITLLVGMLCIVGICLFWFIVFANYDTETNPGIKAKYKRILLWTSVVSLLVVIILLEVIAESFVKAEFLDYLGSLARMVRNL